MTTQIAVVVIVVGTPIAALICWDIARTAARVLSSPADHQRDDYGHLPGGGRDE